MVMVRRHIEHYVKLLFLLLPIFFLFSCNQEEKAVVIDVTEREEIGFEENPNTITYAYVPQYFHGVSYARHNKLVEYLRKETGLPIRQVFPDSFDDYIRMASQGKIDISFANPFVYVKVARHGTIRAFARIIELDGRETFRGQIISRSDNKEIQTLQDCRGKRWVAVDSSSAGGYLFARGLFWDNGIHKDDFAEIAFVPGPGGQQEKVVLAVYSGRYDIGSVREGTLDLVADKIDLNQIRVLAYTDWYPGWMYAARSDLDPRAASAIKDALLKLDCTSPDRREICDAAHISGIIASEDSDYDPIRVLAAKVGIDINQ
jgi:phosphonate transport system substrate-binding protein